jgi:xanthine/uracil permease
MGTFWPIVIAILFYIIALQLGEKFVERITGREGRPENYIFYAGAFVGVSMLILWPFLELMPDANSVIFTAVLCVANTAGFLVAQSLFGRKRKP